ncbi:hypothetical protein BCR34DRAFT_595610 [Clohesyomyces aquaticus]|uniref:Uncharacterized protein n=1 Tax=Clohesyomyces aquaticus TaxID=1231657 RepID=A0A1Y2A9H6_9PLEO|nr:hypothetical protein BCR34DRAFT_595610 [Clohesyomyces aquaticus]
MALTSRTTFPVAIASIPPPGSFLTFSTVVQDPPQSLLYYSDSVMGADAVLNPGTPVRILGSLAHINLYWATEKSIIYWNYTTDLVKETPYIVSNASVATTSISLPASVPASSTTTFISSTLDQTAETSIPATTIGTPTGSNNATNSATNSVKAPGTHRASGISGGQVAGVVIGCLIAGALIAGFLGWFLIGRSRKQKMGQDHEGTTLAFLPHAKGPPTKVHSVESGSPVFQIMDGGLPQPLEDQAITGDMSKLSILIKNHVQSFYHTGRVSPGLLDLDDLQALGDDLPLSTGTLSTLIGNSNTREIALRFCIAWVLVSRMQSGGGAGNTFLPPEIARCLQVISSKQGSRDHAALIARWRTITAELMRSTYASNTIVATDPRFPNIRATTDILDGILRPYMDSRVKNDERRRNLEEISKRAASFAFTLFSQPSTWTFDWKEAEGVKSGSLCIFPALVQITDELAQQLPVPRPFSEAVVRQLDG